MPENLEGPACSHMQGLTDEFMNLIDSKTLWNDYRIDDYIIVSACHHSWQVSDTILLIQCQPFTLDFPCTNIYMMISPNLLHQVIKGTFKITLSPGYAIVWAMCMVRLKGKWYWMTLIDSMFSFPLDPELFTEPDPVLQLYPHFRGCTSFSKGAGSNSGLGTILRC